MKKRNLTIIIISITLLIFIALVFIFQYPVEDIIKDPAPCTNSKICQDGTQIFGHPNLKCEFAPCPDLVYCDALKRCSEGYECYEFEDNENPYCYKGNPCAKCSGKCAVAESYPGKVFCQDN